MRLVVAGAEQMLAAVLSCPTTNPVTWKHAVVGGVIGFLVQIPVPTDAQPAPMPAEIVRAASVEGVTEYRLANGLRALLAPDPSLSTIALNVTYLAGSCHETDGQAGIAHLLEHFVAESSMRHPEAKEEQQERGARYTGITSSNRTNYVGTMPASDANLQWALDLEADRMRNAVLAQKALESHKTIIRNEAGNRAGDAMRSFTRQITASAGVRGICRNGSTGQASELASISIDQVRAFYDAYYQPTNAVVIIVGRFDEAAAVRLIAQKFGGIPRPLRSTTSARRSKPRQPSKRTVVDQHVGDLQLIGAAYRTPPVAHEDSAGIEILTSLLNDRLQETLVRSRKAAQVTSSRQEMLDERLVLFAASVPKGIALNDARAAMLGVLDGAAAVSLTVDELERAKSELVARVSFAIADAQLFSLALGEHAAAGDWRLLFIQRDRFENATRDTVRSVAQKYFRLAATEIPLVRDIPALVEPYRGRSSPVVGDPFEPSLENVEALTRRLVLPNGIKLSLLSRRTRGATVSMNLQLNYGDEKSLHGLAAVAELTASMLSRGTLRRTGQQLQEDMIRMMLTDPLGREGVDISGAGSMTRVAGLTVRQSLPHAMRLIAEVLREPAFPAEEFEPLREERIAAAERKRDSSFDVAALNLGRWLNPYVKGHPRFVPTVDERVADLRAVSLADLREFHRKFFSASNLEIVLVGDFDADSIVSLITELFGDWTAGQHYADIRRPYQHISPVSQTFQVRNQANAEVEGAIRFALSDQDDDYPAIVLANHILGGHPSARIQSRIRSKEGWSYSVGSRMRVFPEPHFFWRNSLAVFSTSVFDNASDFLVYATAAPENAEKVEAAIKEELQRALEDGFTADEVRDAKGGWIRAQQLARSRDTDLAARLLERLHANRTMASDMELQRKIEALTPETILAALRRHLDVSRMSFVRAGSFKR